MSTLGAQLAAINNTPGKGGLALSASKRHDDALGRGLSHSVNHGMSIAASTSHKPSIIYEYSYKALDVPLAPIRNNCIASLRQLEVTDPEF
jgi:hypothetical protein